MGMKPRSTSILLPMRVWDRSVRIFHWAVLLVLITSYVSITLADGPHAGLWMKVHVISGETMLGLILYRIVWGVIGSDTARFSHFLRSPIAALRYLATFARREPDTEVGHNKAGGWMVVALLTLLAVQVGTGLFANDDGSTEGPLMKFVSKSVSDQLSDLHGISFNILIGALALHIAAVAGYAVLKGQNLVRPMITGKKRLPAATKAPRMASPWLAAATLAVVTGVTVAISLL